VLNPASNKGEGLKRACKEMGIPLEEVVAFGDADVRGFTPLRFVWR
jgi:hydroxymethylpyrimidine pyrophosphatase-like HAD family hydrolase